MSLNSAAPSPATTTGSTEGIPAAGPQAGSYQPPLLHPVHRIGASTLDFRRRVALMAIIIRTLDSLLGGWPRLCAGRCGGSRPRGPRDRGGAGKQ